MSRKTPATSVNESGSSSSRHSLGTYLAHVRSVKKLTLREVEEATGKEVSNAYLSQLETGKISKPSPNVLHALAKVYGLAYEVLMEKAGYISPEPSRPASVLRSGPAPRAQRAATFANETLTKEEEEKLLEYLAFLRSRRGRDVAE
jgi:transcriptional regulator with XRE-family HTH domain